MHKFWTHVRKVKNSCWLWQGAKNNKGYGILGPNPVSRRAHRYSWYLKYGKLSAKLLILHKCDNPACVNPNHLFKGTALDNTKDMIRKGRDNFYGRAVLTEQQINIIRKASSTYREIAQYFGVHPSTISRVKNNKTWRQI
jgi:hypothetical protein